MSTMEPQSVPANRDLIVKDFACDQQVCTDVRSRQPFQKVKIHKAWSLV